MATNTAIGFIGTGVMGAAMAGHLLDGGYQLHVHNRTRAKAQALLDRGARWHDHPAELLPEVALVVTMLGFPDDVEACYLGSDGLLEAARPGQVFIDCTTSDPALARRIAQLADERDCSAIDAPVSGGDRGAREGRLSIMVGGEAATVERVRPVLACFGGNIVHQGPAGAGQHCKLANQIAVAGSMIAACEALRFATAAGLDPRQVLNSIAGGAAGSWTLANLAPRMLDEDFAPGFYVKHFRKDLGLARSAAAAQRTRLPGLDLAADLYEQVAQAGDDDAGTQALWRLYQAIETQPDAGSDKESS